MRVAQAGGEKDEADGRRRRSVQSREAIVAALFDLIGQGDPRPSAQRVADRAGVGIRTVFRHFDEMDQLYAEMDARLRATVLPILEREAPTGGVVQRARRLVARRCEIYERLGPYKRAANLHRRRSAFLRKTHREMVRDLRADLDRWLPELRAASARLGNAADVAASFETWDRLRTDQKLSRREAREALETLLESVVVTGLRAPGRARTEPRSGK